MASNKGQWLAFWELSKCVGQSPFRGTLYKVSIKREREPRFGKQETPQYSGGNIA